jgi:hypothetical protein
MSWLYSRALVEEYLGDTCLDGEPSAPSNGSPTQLAYLPQDRMKAFSRLSRFGMTFKPLTADRGEALLTSYLAVFHARTSPQQEKEPGLTASEAGCGHTWRGWLAKLDPDSCLWKTAQCSLLEEEPESLQILPRSGMTRGGLLWERPMSERRTNATEFGSWPTPTVCGNYNRKGLSPTSGDGLATAVMKWPTPTAHNAKEGGFQSEHQRNTPTLAAQAGGSLNPMWVEWLMGWPLGWTDLKPLETDRFQQWQQQHFNY